MAEIQISFLFNEFKSSTLNRISRERQEIISDFSRRGMVTSGAIGPSMIGKMKEGFLSELDPALGKLESLLSDSSNRKALIAIKEFEKNTTQFGETLKNDFIGSTGNLLLNFGEQYKEALTRDLNNKYWAYLSEDLKNSFGHLKEKICQRKNPFWEKPSVKAITHLVAALFGIAVGYLTKKVTGC
jgi:hypothetical protein